MTGSFYSDSACTSATSSTTISANTLAKTVYFKATTSGTATLTVSKAGLNPGEISVIVLPGLFLVSPTNMTADSSGTDTLFSSTVIASWVPTWKAFDGYTSPNATTGSYTYWHSSAGMPQYIGYKRASAYVAQSYELTQRTDDGGSGYPIDFTLQGSNDTTNGSDGTWFTLDTRTGTTWGSGSETKTFQTSSNTTAYTAYRVRATQGHANHFVITEVKVYGY